MGSTIGNAPSGENTNPDGTEKIPLSGSKFIQIANLIARKLRETGGQVLSMGAVSDKQLLSRSGTTVAGYSPWFVDVKQYGAVGNGTTDDTAAIQSAIDAIPANGGIVYFPSGRYKVTSTLNISRDGTHLMGSGAGTYSSFSADLKGKTFIQFASGGTFTNGVGVLCTKTAGNGNLSNLAIKNMAFYCDGIVDTCLDLHQVAFSTFESISINSHDETGIRLLADISGESTGANNNLFKNIFITSLEAATTGIIIGSDTLAATETGISQNTFINVVVRTDGATGNTVGLNLKTCDANTFMQCVFAAYYPVKINGNTDVVDTGVYPESISFYNCSTYKTDAGGSEFYVDGTWSPLSGISFTPYHITDGEALPTDADTHGYDTDGAFFRMVMDLSKNTLTGTVSEFNTALSDGNFATIAGTETLTNKTLTTPAITDPTIGDSQFFVQDGAPSSPSAGDYWFEPDTGILWIYGTYASASRWVSVTRYTSGTNSGLTGTAASTTGTSGQQVMGYDLYIERFYIRGYIITTNDGSNYWTFALRKVSGATNTGAGAGTLLGTVSTAAWSPNAWTEGSVSIDAVVNGTSGVEVLFDDITKVSSPGNAVNFRSFAYRLVHP